MVQNRFHISRLRLHFGMIFQDPDIQPEPSEKVRSPENDFEYVSDSLFLDSSSQKTRHELIRGALFHKAGEHFACRMSLLKGFSKFRASFPKLGRTKQGVDRTSAIIDFRGNVSNKKDSMLTYVDYL